MVRASDNRSAIALLPDVNPDPYATGNPDLESELAPPLRRSWLTRYRDYRVFSWPWLWRRTVLIGTVGLLLGLFSVITKAREIADWRISTLEFVVGVGTFLTCIVPGPFLACTVRSRRWNDDKENAGVILAVLIGALFFAAFIELVERPFEREVLAPRMLATRMLTEKQAEELFGTGVRNPSGIEKPSPGSIHFDGPLWRLVYDSVFCFLCGGGLALPAFFGEKRVLAERASRRQLDALRLQVNEVDLQLMVLQAQIEPHFLFNTLASLRSFIHDDAGRAVAMVDALVEHLRATLPQMREGSGTSTLGQQLAICRSYLDVMKLRMSNRLDYAIEVPMACMDAPFPPLMLLTLVENAVKHGIEPKRGPGMIRIVAAQRQDAGGSRLVVQVIDDGAGLRGGMGHGVGLSNIRSQLALRYRGQGRLSLVGRPEGGTVAALEIPESVPGP